MLAALATVSVAISSPVGWKHHEAPWGEYYNSIPSSHGWERYWKQAWGPAQWELILVGRTTKHHGVNITTPPLPPWMGEVLKTSERACTVRAYLGWKHHGVNITTPPTTLPPLPAWNASPSQHCPPVCCHFSTKLKTCACVCVCVCWGGGGGGVGNLKIYFSCQRKSSDGTVGAQIRTPWYSVWRDHHLSTNILEKRFKPEILQLEIEDNKKNRSSLDKHY